MAADNLAQMTADDRACLNQISGQIIGAAHKVSNGLGTGFLEKVYENALCLELRRMGLQVEQQRPLKVVYEGSVVGDYVLAPQFRAGAHGGTPDRLELLTICGHLRRGYLRPSALKHSLP